MSCESIQEIINQKSILIFDFDGVLVDSVDIKADAFAELYSPYGSVIVEQVVAHHLANGGMNRYDKFDHYHTVYLNMKRGQFDIDKLANQFSTIVKDKVIGCPEVPGAENFIKEICLQHKCYINSATPQNEIRQIISARGLQKYFCTVLGSPTSKSENLRSIRIMNHEVPKSDFLFFGDALSDFEAAANNNLDFIGLAHSVDSVLRGVVSDDMLIKDFTCIVGNP
ncbi:HAD hydrolase-like protein [Amylibacter sp.]|nr:HAD hydrolase-like protein [Amylibacter sp.]